ncbi:hypothetical protein ABIB15_001151 [Marisediminicola sp. UYEF4]|uniref:hypothetical protein n=1 Tax=Marisediminicola sp. UYEF4 TaxID=1756384 RepID=UPI00339878B5
MNSEMFRVMAGAPRQHTIVTAMIVVAAVLFGILAMHTMINSAAAPAAHSSVATAHSASENGAAAASGVHDSQAEAACSASCMPDWMLVGMACAIGVFAVLVALLRHRLDLRRLMFLPLVRVVRIATTRVSLPWTPSLEVLSISRV